MKFFAKGKRGEVFLREAHGKTFLVKKHNPDSVVDTIANEAKFNKLLNAHGIGPEFIAYEQGELVREFIDGLEFRNWLPSAKRPEVIAVLADVLRQCRTMDLLGVEKEEMTRPWKHIIVRKDVPVLIDFERCREVKVPKNVTQFVQFLTSSALRLQLHEKGIHYDKSELINLAKKYKSLLKKN
ncbi:hypothetical protein D6789_02520, partial [Candidatus Woesearchaeota archaeon]